MGGISVETSMMHETACLPETDYSCLGLPGIGVRSTSAASWGFQIRFPGRAKRVLPPWSCIVVTVSEYNNVGTAGETIGQESEIISLWLSLPTRLRVEGAAGAGAHARCFSVDAGRRSQS